MTQLTIDTFPAKLDRKKQIRQIACNMFTVSGYPATSMRDLASEVGIEAASIYSHYKNGKESILSEICMELAVKFDLARKRVLDLGGNPEMMLRNAVIAHVEVLLNNADAAAVFLHDWRHMSEENLEDFIVLRNSYENYFTNILLKGQDIGFFAIGDLQFTCKTILSSVNWVYQWYKPDGKYSPKQIADRLLMIILNGLKFKY